MLGPLGLLVLLFRPLVAVDWSPGSAWLPFAASRTPNFYSLQASVQGRILVLQAQGSQLSLVAQKEVKEAVWTVQAFQVSSLTCMPQRSGCVFWKVTCMQAGRLDAHMAPELVCSLVAVQALCCTSRALAMNRLLPVIWQKPRPF